jgi:transcriptional regulator with GAF, ATPase, and Fis domain
MMAEREIHTGADRERAIIDTFVSLSDTLVDSYDVIDFLHVLTSRCVALADVNEAGVMLASPSGTLQAVAASSERTRLLELYELQNLEGPCLDAYGTGQVVVAGDLTDEVERWPTFSRRAMDVGFHAVHSVPLRLRHEIIGALNLLRAEPGTLDDIDASLVRALADIATVGILQERTIRQSASNASGLQIALTSRIRIEQAKGVLAERSGGSVDEAFEALRSYARRHQLGITAVAERIVAGTLDI